MSPLSVFLVRYGRPGFVGRFLSATPLARGERGVVRSPRGTEIGEVLADLGPAGSTGPMDGEVLRAPTPTDDAALDQLDTRGQVLLAAATAGADARNLPVAFVDVEMTLDGTAVLPALPWAACDATPVLAELEAGSGLTVRLLDLSRTPTAGTEPAAEPGGCGKPGCGSGSAGSDGGGCSTCGTGGGCATGSCSRGTVRSAGELTAYFADLRRKMEAAGIARTPLN